MRLLSCVCNVCIGFLTVEIHRAGMLKDCQVNIQVKNLWILFKSSNWSAQCWRKMLKWNLFESFYRVENFYDYFGAWIVYSDLSDNCEMVIKMYAYEKHQLGSYNHEQDKRNELNVSHDKSYCAKCFLEVRSGYPVTHLKSTWDKRWNLGLTKPIVLSGDTMGWVFQVFFNLCVSLGFCFLLACSTPFCCVFCFPVPFFPPPFHHDLEFLVSLIKLKVP